MTFAKKDFKNIYESGVKELADLELQAIEKGQDKKNEHSQAQRESSLKSLEYLEKKSELLQVELRQSIDESLKKLQDSLAVENAQSEAFLASLMAELRTLTEQMKVKLSALKNSHHENVHFAKTVAAEYYLTNNEEINFKLEHALSNAIQNMSGKTKANFQNLHSNLEQSLVDLQDHIGEVTKSNLVSLKDESYTIADHSSTLLKKFFVDSQSKLTQIETSARQANSEVESSLISLLEQISNHANLIEKDVNSTYESISTAHFQNADNRLSKFADELSTLHETTTEKLITTTDELSDDLVVRSKQVQEGLRSRCEDVVNRLDNLFNSFQGKLNDRLQFSRGQKQALESDKNRILIAVQNEMVSIQKSFAQKIAGMLDQSKIELIDLTNSVEAQMLTTTESLGEKMSASANSIQQQMEKEVNKFLQEISTVRTAALEEISAAARGNSFPKGTQRDLNRAGANETPTVQKLAEDTSSLTDSQLESNLSSSNESELDEMVENEEADLGESKARRNRKRKDNQE